jgi:hypothetical protein
MIGPNGINQSNGLPQSEEPVKKKLKVTNEIPPPEVIKVPNISNQGQPQPINTPMFQINYSNNQPIIGRPINFIYHPSMTQPTANFTYSQPMTNFIYHPSMIQPTATVTNNQQMTVPHATVTNNQQKTLVPIYDNVTRPRMNLCERYINNKLREEKRKEQSISVAPSVPLIIVESKVETVTTKESIKCETMPSLAKFHDLVVTNNGWPIETKLMSKYIRWAGVLGVLTRGKCRGFTKDELLKMSKEDLMSEIGKGDMALGKILYEKEFEKKEIIEIPASLTRNDVIKLIMDHPYEGVLYIASRAGLGIPPLNKKIKSLFKDQNIENFKQLKKAIKEQKITLDNMTVDNINSGTPLLAPNLSSSLSIDMPMSSDKKEQQSEIFKTPTAISLPVQIEKTNTVSNQFLSLHGNNNLFFQQPTSTKKSNALPSMGQEKERAFTDDIILKNSSENSSVPGYPPIKIEPTYENDHTMIDVSTPILKLNKKDLKKVIKILRGDNLGSTYSNCALYCEEIIKYFQTGIMPTGPVGKNNSLDQFATVEYEIKPMDLPKKVKIKQEFPQPKSSQSQSQSHYFTRSKKSTDTQKLPTVVAANVDRNTRLGALLPYDVVPYSDPTGKIDLTKPPIINLSTSKQRQNTIHNISANLQDEASRNPFGVSFGTVCLEACGEDLEKKLGHMLVYYVTTKKAKEVTYIDAWLEKKSIFNDLSIYKFAEAGKEIDDMTYGNFIFTSSYGPVERPIKSNTPRQPVEQINLISNHSSRARKVIPHDTNIAEENRTITRNKK